MQDQRPLSTPMFALAAATPLMLFAAGVLLGGIWTFGGVLYMAVLSILLDQAIPYVAADAPEGAEFPAATAVLVALAVGHLVMLPLLVRAIAGPGPLGATERVLLFVGAGLWFGQVAHPAAHELIHRGGRGLFGLGVAIYTTLLFGHHASAHRLVHHRHVATPDDPNTARSGEGFYRFAGRAWAGSFARGWAAENALRARARGARGLHPYAVYLGGAALCLGLGFLLAGWAGVAVWAGLCLHAQMQILLSDYVQHYGLLRVEVEGRHEPVGPQHSWNTPHWFSSAMMLNAPRHSDHHAHPSRPYPALRLPPADTAPHLPWPLPMAGSIALIPPVWKRMIRPHLRRWKQPATKP